MNMRSDSKREVKRIDEKQDTQVRTFTDRRTQRQTEIDKHNRQRSKDTN